MSSRSIYVPFLFMAEWYSIVSIYHIFFIHSSIIGYLGCFHVSAIVNNAAMNTGGIYLFGVVILFPSDKYPGVGLLGHMVDLYLICWETSIMLSVVAVPICIPTHSALLTEGLTATLLIWSYPEAVFYFEILLLSHTMAEILLFSNPGHSGPSIFSPNSS